jgi:nicotinamide riboside kinase
MEQNMARAGGDLKRVILTGPESTGKTMLTLQLADKYKALCIPEYAREYIMGLNRPYTYRDVEHIAVKQAEQMHEFSKQQSGYLFIDTYLVITKVWFDKVFGKIPVWIEGELAGTRDCLYLLCEPDIPWEPDPVRENGGEMRNVLFGLYRQELEKAGLQYALVHGPGEERLTCAVHQIQKFFK